MIHRKCDHCENEARVHEVKIDKGKKVEKHLCESCACKEGLTQQHAPISDLITKFMLAPVVGEKGVKGGACPSCGMTMAEFKVYQLLGCPRCYTAFESVLGPMIERVQQGATHHVGKTPRGIPAGRGDGEQHVFDLRNLRKRLQEAIEAEEYERAASLRDLLQRAEQAHRTGARPAENQKGQDRAT